jgi:HD-GYP domain-containing protein (c-di-GMP phosphodiesterase class II)
VSRVVTIADSFDAITHRRRYSHARSFGEGLRAIEEGRGTQFDPELTDVFLSLPVRAKIEEVMREVNKPHKNSSNRRRGGAEPAPDVTFRWRPRSRGPRARGRQP